jgi:hypothetical protein
METAWRAVWISYSVLLCRDLPCHNHYPPVSAAKCVILIAKGRAPKVEGVLLSGSVGEDNLNFV